ncbi:hypothetical protein B0H17DRAFT_1299470 [Mycena rosella]|uniref:Uncharacterized protein n=1 Tax=Mycena rosella TaxID=1033263 RepID=A0AAD7BC31_MYCRO|nr:hypothetical protein B0H17DRAFT_1299470 [Mycena rosella]
MSALMGFSLMLLTISCDFACQWKQNLRERMPKLPASKRLQLNDLKLQCALPVWHAASHNVECQNENSLSFKPGVRKSDGEGVERMWAALNPAAFSTKDAGTGQRADILEGKIDNHNYLKNVGQGVALQRKLVVALAERARQINGFKQVNATISKQLKKQWKTMIDDWLEDKSKPNPFTLSRKDCPTEAEVRREVRKDEDALTAGGKAPLHGRSATAFLVAGIQIRTHKLAGTVLVAADRENKIEEWRHMLLKKIATFRSLQKIYMPGVAETIEETEAARDTDNAPPKPERVALFMPSAMVPKSEDDTLGGCVRGLLQMEAKLRVAICLNTLVSLRSRLHAKRHLIGFRDENITGQYHSTKARSLIEQVGERVEAHVKRYQLAQAAVIVLKGLDAHPELQELKPEDVRLDGDAGESDSAARKKLAMLSAGQGARPPRNAPGTSKRLMSWIWTMPGALDDEEERLHKSIRVKWARARARKVRWCEEGMLLREEMRRAMLRGDALRGDAAHVALS